MLARLAKLLGQPRMTLQVQLRPGPQPGIWRVDTGPATLPSGLCALPAQGTALLDAGAGPNPEQPLWPLASEGGWQRLWIPEGTRALYWMPQPGAALPARLPLQIAGGITSAGNALHRCLRRVRAVQYLMLLLQARATRRPRFRPAPLVSGGNGDGMLEAADHGVWGLLDFGRAGVPRGLCRIRLRADTDDGQVDAMLYFDDGLGFRPTLAQALGGGASSQLRCDCFIPLGTRGIRLDASQRPGTVRLRDFSITPMGLGPTIRRALLARLQHRAPALLWRLPASLRQRLLRQLDAAAVPAALRYAHYLAGSEAPLDEVRAAVLRHQHSFALRPVVSILMPVHNTPVAWLLRAIRSVQAQTWPQWELCIADDASSDPAVLQVLRTAAAQDPRVRIETCASNGGISAASNAALSLATGDYVGFLDHDDELHPLALYYVVEALQHHPDLELIYTDEDKIDTHGHRHDPHFKPDWDPDLLQSINYIAHFAVYRRQRVIGLGGLRSACDGSQDYDLALRVTRLCRPEQIHHVPMPLYHWRAIPGSTALALDQKSYPHQSGLHALRAHTLGSGATVMDGAFPTSYRVQYPLPEPAPRASLIIPTRDGLAHLRVCIDSVLHRTDYPNYQLLVIDNQSRDPDTLAYLDVLATQSGVRVLHHDAAFNFSAINNAAARAADGQVLVLLNDDTEVLSPGWLTELVSLAMRADTGAVGAKLYYPDGSIQHGGVALGIGGVAGHLHLHAERSSTGYLGRLRLRQSVGAVTGACLAVEKRKFDAVGGLDEDRLAVAFNDIDLCLKLAERGWRSVWTPWAELIHHESKSRGPDTAADKVERFNREVEYMKRRWGARLRRDPYFSPHFSRQRHDYGLAEQPFSLRPWAMQHDTEHAA